MVLSGGSGSVAVNNAAAESHKLFPLEQIEDTVSKLEADANGLIAPLDMIISKLEDIIGVGDEISKVCKCYIRFDVRTDVSEIHRYAHSAWKILTVVYRVIFFGRCGRSLVQGLWSGCAQTERDRRQAPQACEDHDGRLFFR